NASSPEDLYPDEPTHSGAQTQATGATRSQVWLVNPSGSNVLGVVAVGTQLTRLNTAGQVFLNVTGIKASVSPFGVPVSDTRYLGGQTVTVSSHLQFDNTVASAAGIGGGTVWSGFSGIKVTPGVFPSYFILSPGYQLIA